MSILVTPTKHRVTHRKGYKLGIDDGIITPDAERATLNRKWWMGGHNVDHLASSQKPLDPERTAYNKHAVPEKWHCERQIVGIDSGEGVLVRVNTKAAPEPKAKRDKAPRTDKGTASRPAKETARQFTPRQVDDIIRATGYTGPINARMRAAARDLVAHRTQVRAYTKAA